MDVAIIADAATSALKDPEVHTLATLVPDIIQTTMIALLGLSGAYLTQGAEGVEAQPEPRDRVRRRSRVREDELSDEFLPPSRKRRDDDWWDDDRW